jgi:hypothetical protein
VNTKWKRGLRLATLKGEAMKKTSVVAGVLVTGILLSCGLETFAQQKEPGTPPGLPTFSFVSSEFVVGGKPIKSSPYSAEAITETTQILRDGNRIINRSTASLYRDSEGRTRREQTLRSISGVATGARPLQTIMIGDPVAGVSYSLDPANRVARKIPMNSTFARTPSTPNRAALSVSNVFSSGSNSDSKSRTVAEKGAGGGGRVTPTRTNAPSVSRTAQSDGGAGYQVNKEDLGTQTIEGVVATGRRLTITIPAGQIGNERPIEVVDERWFSNDLQMLVMTRRLDPRSGETVYRLTNINRSEPDKSLFEVPADYEVKDNTSLPRTRKPE